MGISGHILGPKKLRKLSGLTGLPLSRAYIRGNESEGVIWVEEGCQHYDIDWRTGDYTLITSPSHWGSCRNLSLRE